MHVNDVTKIDPISPNQIRWRAMLPFPKSKDPCKQSFDLMFMLMKSLVYAHMSRFKNVDCDQAMMGQEWNVKQQKAAGWEITAMIQAETQ